MYGVWCERASCSELSSQSSTTVKKLISSPSWGPGVYTGTVLKTRVVTKRNGEELFDPRSLLHPDRINRVAKVAKKEPILELKKLREITATEENTRGISITLIEEAEDEASSASPPEQEENSLGGSKLKAEVDVTSSSSPPETMTNSQKDSQPEAGVDVPSSSFSLKTVARPRKDSKQGAKADAPSSTTPAKPEKGSLKDLRREPDTAADATRDI